MKWRLPLTAASLLGLIACADAAKKPDYGPASDALLVALVWIQENSDYKNLPVPRGWGYMTQDQMQRTTVYRSDGTVGVPVVYECGSQTYFIRPEVNWKLLFPQAVMVATMVEHAQCINHRFTYDSCSQQREAFGLAAKFVRSGESFYTKEDDRQNLMALITGLEAAPAKACGQ